MERANSLSSEIEFWPEGRIVRNERAWRKFFMVYLENNFLKSPPPFIKGRCNFPLCKEGLRGDFIV
jgi:hypothetical protein